MQRFVIINNWNNLVVTLWNAILVTIFIYVTRTFYIFTDADRAMLDAIADKDPAANLRAEGMKPRVFVKGTRLCRDWKGKTYEVLVHQDGRFEYEGEIYRSLTAIAEKITGTHWNGKKFFGVK